MFRAHAPDVFTFTDGNGLVAKRTAEHGRPNDPGFWKTVHDDAWLALHAALYTWPAGFVLPGRVLDLGSEYGFGSLLISNGNRSLQVLSMDLDAAGLRYASGVSGKEKISRVNGDASRLPVASESFTGIYLIHLLHLVDNPERVVREAWRALKPAGVAIVSTPQDSSGNGGQQVEALKSELNRRFSEVLYPDQIRGELPSFRPQDFRLDGQAPAWLAICRKNSTAGACAANQETTP